MLWQQEYVSALRDHRLKLRELAAFHHTLCEESASLTQTAPLFFDRGQALSVSQQYFASAGYLLAHATSAVTTRCCKKWATSNKHAPVELEFAPPFALCLCVLRPEDPLTEVVTNCGRSCSAAALALRGPQHTPRQWAAPCSCPLARSRDPRCTGLWGPGTAWRPQNTKKRESTKIDSCPVTVWPWPGRCRCYLQ